MPSHIEGRVRGAPRSDDVQIEVLSPDKGEVVQRVPVERDGTFRADVDMPRGRGAPGTGRRRAPAPPGFRVVVDGRVVDADLDLRPVGRDLIDVGLRVPVDLRRQPAIKLTTDHDVRTHEAEIVGRINAVTNGGALFLAGPWQTLESVNVTVAPELRQRLEERIPGLDSTDDTDYRRIKAGTTVDPDVTLLGLFPEASR